MVVVDKTLVPLARVCSLCSKVFFPPNPEARPLYCSPRHREDARLSRKRWTLHHGGRCPVPHKRTFETVQEADEACIPGQGLNAYRCVCGSLHIGHPDTKKKFGIADMVAIDTVLALNETLHKLHEETGRDDRVLRELATVKHVLAELESRYDRKSWIEKIKHWVRR